MSIHHTMADNRLRLETVRISSQHEHLNELYADLRRQLELGADHNALVCFSRLRDTLDAHFEIEDRTYFPVVAEFRPDRRELLASLSSDHVEFRDSLNLIERLLMACEREESQRLLAQLVRQLLQHEALEDQLLAEITHDSAGRFGSAPLASVEGPSVDPE